MDQTENITNKDPIEVRYPHQENNDMGQNVALVSTTEQAATKESTNSESLTIEKTATTNTVSVETPTVNADITRETAQKSDISNVKKEQTTEIQQNLPFDEQPELVVTLDKEIEQTKAATNETEASPKSSATADTQPVEKEVTNEDVAPSSVIVATNIETKTATTNNAVEMPTEKKAKTKTKTKKAAGKRLKGKGSAPMTTPKTISSVGEIPTASFIAEDRNSLTTSGRSAMVADVINKSSAVPTKAAGATAD